MARVDLPEPYALRNMRKSVQEALQAHGEEIIGFSMYHPVMHENVPRCPVCYDSIYKQATKAECNACFGTTYEGGIREMSRMWATFSTDTLDEHQKKRGIYQPFGFRMQAEHHPMLLENDYVMRVKRWSQAHHPLEIHAAYAVRVVTPESLRTGNQLGQDGQDYVGQRAMVDELPREHVIYQVLDRGIVRDDFPVLRSDGRNR